MPECHKCEHNGNSDEACLKCKGPADTPHNDGVNIVSIEHACNEYKSLIGQCSSDETSIIAELMRIWIRSTPTEREAIAYHITQPELSYATIARRVGLTRAAISKAVRKCDIDVHDMRDVSVKREESVCELTLGL